MRAELFLNWVLADLPPPSPLPGTEEWMRMLRRRVWLHRATTYAGRAALVLAHTGVCLWIGWHLR